jgi:hypothetical protein
LLDDARDDDPFTMSLCAAAPAVVLSMPTRLGSKESIEVAALSWAAEHAYQLGATSRLLLAGVCVGGGHAARLAMAARDLGWPALHRQLLVHPMFDAACPMPSRLEGAAPATIVTADVTGMRYADRLRAARIDVAQLRVRDRSLPRGAELAELVDSLALGPADEPLTGRPPYQI